MPVISFRFKTKKASRCSISLYMPSLAQEFKSEEASHSILLVSHFTWQSPNISKTSVSVQEPLKCFVAWFWCIQDFRLCLLYGWYKTKTHPGSLEWVHWIQSLMKGINWTALTKYRNSNKNSILKTPTLLLFRSSILLIRRAESVFSWT